MGEAFTAAADGFVRRYLSRGIPSLFSALRPLLRDPAKAEALGHLFRRLEAGLVADGAFPPLAQAPGGAAAEPAAPEKAQSPQTLVWTRFYLAQHCDALGDTGEALRLIDDCIQVGGDARAWWLGDAAMASLAAAPCSSGVVQRRP